MRVTTFPLRLRRAGLVESVRGANLHPVDPERCSPEAPCSIRPVWRMLGQRINELLAGISLPDLMQDEPQVYQIAGVSVGN